jgi:hypothetical protein
MVIRPFSPALPEVSIVVGMPAVRPSPHAETFARVLREVASETKARGRGK